MSFSSTPLGQGRRLDQHTFLGKPNSTRATSPQRTSYAYGASTSGTRSPPKPSSPIRESIPRHGSRPQTITSVKPPKVNDTSVNIASAFTQAASMSNPNSSWASGSNAPRVNRSTSVEYEQSQTNARNRLAPPPNKLAGRTARKPISKASSSQQIIPDSQEQHQSQSQDAANGRGKSPFNDMLSNIATTLTDRASFYVRQRQADQDSASYDYAEEEDAFQNDKSGSALAKRAAAQMHKRSRISTDNKAYRPTASDDSSDDDDADGKPHRRRKIKKNQLGGGPLNTLPVVGATKRRKGHKSSKSNVLEEEEEARSITEELDQSNEQDLSNQNESFNLPPTPRAPSEQPYAEKEQDSQGPIQINGLGVIPEEGEEAVYPSHSRFSIGTFFGKIVRWISMAVITTIGTLFRHTLSLIFMSGKMLGTLFDLCYRRPSKWISSLSPLLALTKYAILAGIILGACYVLQAPLLHQLSRISSPGYHAPSVPAGNVDELANRLLTLEQALSEFSQESQQIRTKYDEEARTNSELVSRIASLEGRLQRESARALEAEGKLVAATNKDLRSVQSTLELLDAQLQAKEISSGPITDEDARLKVKQLEERVIGVEGSVHDLSRNAVKVVGSATGAVWRNKLKSGVTIKSSDGQDVTALINDLVTSSVSMLAKDGLGRADLALYSAGGRVIPRWTSEYSSSNIFGQVFGMFSIRPGALVVRPPVTALHHETRQGYCWPFRGSQGHIGVALAAPAYVSEITIDHIPAEVAFDLRTAPRDMDVWALVEGEDNVLKLKTWQDEKNRLREESGQEPLEDHVIRPSYLEPTFIRIASFTFNVHSHEHIQTFPVLPEIRELGIDFGIVVLDVKSNWGQPEFTCLYRLRVHGELRIKPPPPDAEQLE